MLAIPGEKELIAESHLFPFPFVHNKTLNHGRKFTKIKSTDRQKDGNNEE